MRDGFQIREVEAADVPAVLALVTRVLAEYGFTFGIGSKSDDELRALPSSYTANGGGFWVALAPDGAVVGTGGIAEVEPGIFELRKMYLLKEARGFGLGRGLLEKALDHARRAGGRRVVLDTVEGMTDAIALYERAGFVRDDTQIRAARCTRGYRLEL